MDQSGIVKIYSISILYWDNVSKFYVYAILECPWCLPFGVKIVHIQIWRMAFLTWTGPGDNLNFYGKNP